MEKRKHKVITIPNEAIVELKMGGAFYHRLHKVLIDHTGSTSKEHLLVAVDLIKRDMAEKNDFAYNMETLFILLRDVEKAFQDAGLTVEEEMEFEIPDKPKEN